MNKCGCYDVNFPVYNESYSSCILAIEKEICNQNTLELIENADNITLFSDMNCEYSCPLECKTQRFSYTLTAYNVKKNIIFKRESKLYCYFFLKSSCHH